VLSLKPRMDSRGPSSPEAGRQVSRPPAGTVVRIEPVGARSQADVQALDQLPGISNYFMGSDPAKWRTGIPTYSKVKYDGIYPGVDLVYYGNQRQLEFDFVVAPGADPSTIKLAFQGIDDLEVGPQGDLLLKIGRKEVRMQKPAIYQEGEDGRQPIPGEYVIRDNHQIGFVVAAYDTGKPLVIDPVLSFSTYLGGSGEDSANSIFVDASGSIYLTGSTTSDVPGAFPTTTGSLDASYGGSGDAFVSKIDPDGPTLLYSTYLGGAGQDLGNGIVVDGGNAYVTGSTTSDAPNPFPTTGGAFSTTYGGAGDAFVTKVNPAGTRLTYSTSLGGRDADVGYAIAVDSSNQAVVTGSTASPNFPLQNALPGNDRLGGGSGSGTDAFGTGLSSTGTALLFSTYLCGADVDVGRAVAVEAPDTIYVAGSTNSPDFPLQDPLPGNAILGGGTNTSTDGFVTKITESTSPPPGNSVSDSGGGGGCFIATASAFEPLK